jgi:type I pantothenate kinase
VQPARAPEPVDPVLVDLARQLDAEADRRSGRSSGERGDTLPWRRPAAEATTLPVVVAVVGSVAAGKSTAAAALAASLSVPADVVATDAFLLSNEQLEPLGGAAHKGYPESFDWAALDRFLTAARDGRARVESPVYSHEVFDVLPGVVRRIDVPEVLVVEGLNLLQHPPDAPPPPAEHLDLGIYLEASEELLEQWFVERFVALTRPADGDPSEFYAQFAAMADDDLRATARWVWQEINAPNLHQHVAPSRRHADLVLHKGLGHRIERVERLR